MDVALDIKKRARLVTNIEKEVITLVEKRFAIWEKERELMTVPIHAVILTIPAMETSAPIDGYIIGQAAPSMLSGSPKEIKDIYMMTKSRMDTIFDSPPPSDVNGGILSSFFQGATINFINHGLL